MLVLLHLFWKGILLYTEAGPTSRPRSDHLRQNYRQKPACQKTRHEYYHDRNVHHDACCTLNESKYLHGTLHKRHDHAVRPRSKHPVTPNTGDSVSAKADAVNKRINPETEDKGRLIE